MEKAVTYLIQAGDAAARGYAYAEARLHYGKALAALEHLPDTPESRLKRVETTISLVSASVVAENPERNITRLAMVEPLARELPGPDGTPGGDKLRLARVHYWMGRSHFYAGAPAEAINYFKQVLTVAQESGDDELLALPSSVLGQAMITQGRFDRALPLLSQALDPLARAENWAEWVRACGYLGLALAAQGRYAEAVQKGDSALDCANDLKNPTSIGTCYLLRGWIQFLGGDMPAMRREARSTVQVAEEVGDLLNIFVGYGELAWATSRLGQHEAAASYMARSKETASRVQGRLVLTDLFASAEAELALNAGNNRDALTLAKAALERAKASGNLLAEGLAERTRAEALAILHPERWDEAQSYFASSLERLEMGGIIVEVARTHVAWAKHLRERGDIPAAREHLELAAERFERSSLSRELAAARKSLAELDLARAG
jgi:adenylate cyclase